MRYKYRVLDTQGQEINGILTATTEREAIRQLQQRGLTALNLTLLETGTTLGGKKGTPKQRDLVAALHELTTLLEAGISLIEAIESLAHSSHHSLITQTFTDMAMQLRQGIAFSNALRTCPLKLPWYLYQLAEAGELTGRVAIALRDGVTQMEYEMRVTSEVRSAMIYPSVLIVSGIAAVIAIFTLVVPRFAGILKSRSGSDLPWLADFVLNAGLFFNTHFIWLSGGLFVLLAIAIYLWRQPPLRAKFKDTVVKLPLIGTWIIEAETARWAALMSTLLENRVSLLRALELANQGTQLPSLSARLTQVNKAVRTGHSLSQSLQDNEALTPVGYNLIRAGERAGELPKMLHSLAKLLEETGRTRMKRFLLLIEPIAILMIGGIIGLIMTGVILAITSVNTISL